tara:strand:+ start:5707 stop:5970 length:264 start_codon:yes stop_codon:yes gene_type:complete
MLLETNDLVKLLIGALTLVASLAWNDAFRSLFSRYTTLKKYGPWFYALFVTILIYILIRFLNNFNNLTNTNKNDDSKNSKLNLLGQI